MPQCQPEANTLSQRVRKHDLLPVAFVVDGHVGKAVYARRPKKGLSFALGIGRQAEWLDFGLEIRVDALENATGWHGPWVNDPLHHGSLQSILGQCGSMLFKVAHLLEDEAVH